MLYDAVILAGSTPKERDELLEYTRADRKALVPVLGKEMVRYVAEALVESGRIGRLIIVGLDGSSELELGVGVPVRYLPNRGSLLGSFLAAAKELDGRHHAIFCAADIPLLTAEAVRDFIDRCEAIDVDVAYPVIERSVMEATFPGSGRSFRSLKDGDYAGGDLSWVRPDAIVRNQEHIQALHDTRKSALRTARTMGLGLIALFLLGRLTIEYAERRAARLFGCTCKAVISPYAEIGMDVDKVTQYQLVCSLLQGGTR